ncbi:MAG: RNA-binding protein [Akkermansiaceae bacterium]|nr:RNA-binding protein [Akkermansiaceae bacterium]MCF7732172.1 RNA-binding protein [Akkermansiaceae bacterium]
MSNATENPRNQGDQQRRRRNRGGKNRRNQDGNDSRDRRGSRDSRDSREFSPGRDARGQGPNRRSNQPSNTPPRRYAPVKLTWWQKLLKLVGLYKEPARPERRPAREATEPRIKSNTRNLRSGDSETETDTPPARSRDRDRDRDGGGRRPERRGGDRDSVESPRVYVGNLSYDVSESDLQDLFKGIGGVRNVEIVYNRATHRSKGYGFVEMLHVDEAKRAVEVLHDQPFMGRPLTVSGAKSKGQDEREEREDREERPERPERRPRNNPPAAAAAAAVATEETATVTAETLGDTGGIATIVQTPAAEEPETTPPVTLDLLGETAEETPAETPAEVAEETPEKTAEETKPEQA